MVIEKIEGRRRSRRPSVFVYSLSTKYHDSPSILLFRLCVRIAVLFLRYLVIVGLRGHYYV
nr:MAG TPA: hypothetical protein [Caudoviricetes sp.]